MAPSSLINTLSHQLPIFFLPLIFSPAVGGLYFLAIKVLIVPSYLIGLAALEVFKNKAQDDFRQIGNCRIIFIKLGLGLFCIGIVPGIFFFFFAPTFFLFVFGPQWTEAGEYAQILIPLALVGFVCSPLSYVLILRKKLFLDLSLQLIFLILVVITLLIAAVIKSLIVTIWLLTISGIIFYVITLFFSYKYSKTKI
jgi:O-antigen/teichoic acid export membrane protein